MAALMIHSSRVLGTRLGCTSRRGVSVHAPRSVVVRAGADRPTWYPGATPPSHLDGSLPGDYGFDPLRLGTNPERLKWFRFSEIYHGQLAMAAVVGILITEILKRPSFYEAGAMTYPVDVKTLVAIELAVWGSLELVRYNAFKKSGETNFDPMKMKNKDTQLKEIKNGRLAMLAVVGFFSQYAVRGVGPIECLKLHIQDPGHNNIYNTSVGPETCVTVALLAVWPIIVEASKSLNKKESVPIFPWNEPWAAQEDDNKVAGTEI